jgi:hypothetical protein
VSDRPRPLSESVREALRLLPLHAVGEVGGDVRVVRRRGRPVAVRREIHEDDYHRALGEVRERAVASDLVVGACASQPTCRDLLNLLTVELAKEAAAIGWERAQHERLGTGDVALLAGRRVRALSALADIVRESHAALAGELDPGDPRLDRIFETFVESVMGVLRSCLEPEAAERLGLLVRARLDGWQEQVGLG